MSVLSHPIETVPSSQRSFLGSTECQRSLEKLLAPLEQLSATSAHIKSEPQGSFASSGRDYFLPRYIFSGPQAGGDPLRIGLFAGVHGDQVEGVYALVRFLTVLAENPQRAAGFTLYFYPVINPTGFEDHTLAARSGRDLNSEFWTQSREPEVALLQQEILTRFFHGILSLQTDVSSPGIYGLVRGAALTKHLLKSALAIAGQVLPRNVDEVIGGQPAREGVIQNVAPGILSAPPGAHPRPFEITLVLPKGPSESHKEGGAVLALQTILEEYRQFIAYAANL